MGKVRIAVIDDGINQGLYNLGQIEHDLEITPELCVRTRRNDDPYVPGHGTVCAAIISKYYPDAYLSSLKILNSRARGNREQLLKAIEWCGENGIQLVNLSLGTVDYRDFAEMRRVINRVSKNGLMIVAACNNTDMLTYPATLANVIGVKADQKGVLTEGEYLFNLYPPDGIEITACGSHTLTQLDGERTDLPSANSYAAPLMTALVAKILERDPERIGLERIKEELWENAVKLENASAAEYCPWITKVLLTAEKAVWFTIGSCQNAVKLVSPLLPNHAIVDIEKMDYADDLQAVIARIREKQVELIDVDTLIIAQDPWGEACCDQNTFMEQAAELGKNVVFTREGSHSSENFNLKKFRTRVWHPSLCNLFYHVADDSVEDGDNFDIPLIVVYDFSGVKLLETMVHLADHFKADGYNVGSVTDAPAGIVAGIEYIPEKCPDEINASVLKMVNRIYRPDVMILGVLALDRSVEYIRSVERFFEVDLQIMIANEWTDREDRVVSINEECNVIRVVGRRNEEPEQVGQEKTFYYNEADFQEDLYKWVIDLFDRSETEE